VARIFLDWTDRHWCVPGGIGLPLLGYCPTAEKQGKEVIKRLILPLGTYWNYFLIAKREINNRFSEYQYQGEESMNKTRLLWGIICLALAGLLTILNLTLPPNELMFQIGDKNIPWVPPVVFAIVGIVLLATTGSNGKSEITAASQVQPEKVQDNEKAALNKRLETIGWGCFLIMLAGFSLVPDELVHKGVWSIGVGIILIGLNMTRYFLKIRMGGFTTFLGILSLLGGISELLGWTSLDGAWLLLILGAYLILKPWFEKKMLFGKAEEN
jgi:hypothetical protein